MPKVTTAALQGVQMQPPAVGAAKPGRLGKVAAKLKIMLVRLVHRNYIWANLLALFLGRLTILGDLSPFGLAFFAAAAQLERERAPVTAVWAVAGVVSAGHYYEAGVYLFAIGLYFWLGRRRLRRRALLTPLFLFAAVLVGGLAVNLALGRTLYYDLAVLCNASLCMLSAYLFLYGMPLLLSRPRILAAYEKSAGEGLICLVLILALAVAGIGKIEIGGYDVRNIAGSVLVMALAWGGGPGLGASAGVMVGLIAGLSDGAAALPIALYAFAGLMAGIFRAWGKYAVILAFLLGSAVVNLSFTQLPLVLNALTESVIAAVALFLIPLARLLGEQPAAEAAGAPDQAVAEASGKMQYLAALFDEMAAAFGAAAAGAPEQIRDEEVARLLTAAGEQVCEHCPQRPFCWEEAFYPTYQALLAMIEQAGRGPVAVYAMPRQLRENCVRRQELADVVNREIKKNQMIAYWRRRWVGQRRMVTEQLKGVGIIIGNLAMEMSKQPQTDKKGSLGIKEKALAAGCPLESVRLSGPRGAATVEIVKAACDGTHECINTLLPLTAAALKERLTIHSDCGDRVTNKKCRIVLKVAQRFRLETGAASKAKEKEARCGDTCAVADLSQGRAALMLSDGMGCGDKAAGESRRAVSFLSRLLAAGFDVAAAVRTVNSLLLVRSEEETFATLDMAVVDLYTGAAEFLKIGAAASFIKRVHEVHTVQAASLPIGIINQVEIAPVRVQLAAGDLVVMVSDGIADLTLKNGERSSWIENFLRRSQHDTAQELADAIIREAARAAEGAGRDDMSVLAARLVERPGLGGMD